MEKDYFDIEELIVSDGEKEKYEKEVFDAEQDEQEFIGIPKKDIENMGVDDFDLDGVDLTIEDIRRHIEKYGREAAVKYIEELKSISEKKEDDHAEEKENNASNDSMKSIDLSTKSFVSPLTNEIVNLYILNPVDRIAEIYYHTGISVSVTDPVFMKRYEICMSSYKQFLDKLPSRDVARFKRNLGKKWKEELLKRCGKSWNEIIAEEINKEKDKATNRLREDLKNEKSKSEQLDQRVGVLTALNNIEKRRNEDLKFNVNMLETSRNDALDQLRDAKEVLSQKQTIDNVPEFVTNADMNVYDYVVSQDVVNPEGKSK